MTAASTTCTTLPDSSKRPRRRSTPSPRRPAAWMPPASRELDEADDWPEPKQARRGQALRHPGRRDHRLDPAGGRHRDHPVPHPRRPHRLPRIQAQTASRPSAGGLAAGRRRGLRRTAAELLAGPRTRAGRSHRLHRRHHRLVRTGPFLRFPQLAIHLDRQVNDGAHPRQAAAHEPGVRRRRPDGGRPARHLATLGRRPRRPAGRRSRRATTSWSPTPRRPPFFGRDGALFASGRLDNLSSVHAGTRRAAPTRRRPTPATSPCSPPSTTRSSARPPAPARAVRSSPTCSPASAPASARREDRHARYAGSWCLSSDAGHAVHPNYAERHDPANRPVPGGGPLLKINANQRYATDARGRGAVGRGPATAPACRTRSSCPTTRCRAARPSGRSPRPGSASAPSMSASPLLSMHSARELCGVDDPAAFTDAIEAFLRHFVGADPIGRPLRRTG